MKQLFYSEVLKKSFETEKECLDAEAKYNAEHAAEIAKKEARTAKAKEVEQLYKDANEAYKKANDALNAFVKEYGSFHATYTDSNLPTTSLFDAFFNNFWF